MIFFAGKLCCGFVAKSNYRFFAIGLYRFIAKASPANFTNSIIIADFLRNKVSKIFSVELFRIYCGKGYSKF